MTVEDVFSAGDFDDDFRPFGTIGVKGLIDLEPYFEIGLFAQGSVYSTFKDQDTVLVGGVPVTQQIKIKDFTEIYAGLLLQRKINNICIYGGPFLYWTEADVEVSILEMPLSGSDTFEEPNNFGGAVGIKIPVSQTINIELEAQYRQAFSGGGSFTYSF
ncbi:MAG: hypothetical protein ACOC6E_02425 [Thermodesulfobacteriota bacterium]